MEKGTDHLYEFNDHRYFVITFLIFWFFDLSRWQFTHTVAQLKQGIHCTFDLWFHLPVDWTLFYGYHTPRLLGLYICDSLQRNNHSPLEFRGLFWSSGAISTTARVCHWWVLLSIIIYYTIYKYYKWHRLCIAYRLKSSESKKNFDDCIIAINVWLYTLSTN